MNARNRVDCPKYCRIISKESTKSDVWEFFGLPGDENGKILTEKISICHLCLRAVSSKATSNLWSHLKCHHALQYKNLISRSNIRTLLHDEERNDDVNEDDIPIQTSNTCCSAQSYESNPGSSNSQSYKTRPSSPENLPEVKYAQSLLDCAALDNSSEEKCTLAITKFLATGMQPYSLVEDDSFKQMIKILNPRYTMPGRKYFSSNSVPKLYTEAVENLKKALPKSSCLSITCDCWTSLAGQPYIAITAHFIDFNWNLISTCLGCCYFEENYTAQNIKNMIQNKLEEWGLNSQSIISCTTDNGANIIKAVDLLCITRIPCFADSINIGVNNCIEIQQVKKAVGRLKLLQNSIAHSWQMKRELKEAQELLQQKVKPLPSACSTRWGSILKLCERFLENQLPISKMMRSFPTQKHLMTEASEVSVIESFVKVVAILQDVTDNLTGENFITSSAVLPLIRQIKKNLGEDTEDAIFLKSLKEKVVNPLARFEDEPLQRMLRISTFIDPRFRLYFFDDDVKDKVKQAVIDELNILCTLNILCDKDSITDEVKFPPKKKKKGLAALLEEEDESTDNPKDKNVREIEKYLSMPKVGLDDNPLVWWKHYTSSFPGLSAIAKKYFCIQGSSVPAERVFSKGGNIINEKRFTLSPKNAEMQIFLAYNKKILETYL